MIKPVESFQYVKDLKNRLRLDNVDFIVYDSGFFTPLAIDNFTHELLESEMVELFGNPPHIHRVWDREDE